MQTVILYVSTAVVFLGLDAIALRFLIKPVFERHIGDWLLDSPRLAPAAAFYSFYVVGILVFCSYPALAADSPARALLLGALLGAVAYGTYEFTNISTLRDWAWPMLITDWLWGTTLTAVSAWAGVMVVRAFA